MRLTLLVAARTRDGIAALSDRKESVRGSGGNEVSKYYLDAAGGCYMSLSGYGDAAGHLLGRLGRRQTTAAGTFREIDSLVAGLHAARQKTGHMAGRLILAGGGRFEPYTVTMVSGIAAFVPNRESLPVEGDFGAIVLCKNLARDVALPGMPCKTAKCLHAIASRMAEAAGGAGERDKYGIDIVVFTMAGAAARMLRRTDRMGTLSIRFDELAGTGPLPSLEGGV